MVLRTGECSLVRSLMFSQDIINTMLGRSVRLFPRTKLRNTSTTFQFPPYAVNSSSIPMNAKSTSSSVQNILVCLSDSMQGTSQNNLLNAACEIADIQSGNYEGLETTTLMGKRMEMPMMTLIKQQPQVHVCVDTCRLTHALGADILQFIESETPDLCVLGISDISQRNRVLSSVQFIASRSASDVLIVKDMEGMTSAAKALLLFNEPEAGIHTTRALLKTSQPGDCIEALHFGGLDEEMVTAVDQLIECEFPHLIGNLTVKHVRIRDHPLYTHMQTAIDHCRNNGIQLVAVGAGSVEHVFSHRNFTHFMSTESPLSLLIARGESIPIPNQETATRGPHVEYLSRWILQKSFI